MNQQNVAQPAPEKRTGPRVGIGCLSISAFISLFFMIVLVADPQPKGPNAFGAFAVFGMPAIVMGAGAFLWYRALTGRERRQQIARHEKIVLRMVASAGGCATLAQVVEATPLSIEEAEAVIEALGRKGLVHYDLLDDGTVLYRFGGLVGEGEGGIVDFRFQIFD